MKAALFEPDSWRGHQKYIFKGESASDILAKFEQIQDLSCLVLMGRDHEGKKGQKQFDALEKMLDKYYSGELTMQDLQSFDVKISIGAMKCSGIAESDEAVEKLIADNPDAR